jgi:hypothetical protein
LLNPAAASAMPSSTPINITVKPICFKNKGIMGYSISLEISVNILTNESTQIVLVIIRFGGSFSRCNGDAFFECSNLLVHCRIFCLLPLQRSPADRRTETKKIYLAPLEVSQLFAVKRILYDPVHKETWKYVAGIKEK